MPTETPNLPAQVHQRPGTAVAKRTYGGTDNPSLDAGDILIPRLKVGQPISGLVTRRVVGFGDIFVIASRDDQEPVILAEMPKGEDIGPTVRFYTLGEPRKGWSWKPAVEGGDWRGPEYPNLALVEGQDPRKVRRTYDYLVTVPGYDMLPVRFLMHGQWAGQSAKQLNTQLVLNRQRGVESHTVAYKLQARITSSPKDGQDRPFAAALVGIDKVSAKDKRADLELVESHIALVGSGANVQELDDSDTIDGRTQAEAAAVDAPSLD